MAQNEMATKKRRKNASGPTLSYAVRKAKGRPIVGFSLPQSCVDEIGRLAERLKMSKSAVVDIAVSELGKRCGSSGSTPARARGG